MQSLSFEPQNDELRQALKVIGLDLDHAQQAKLLDYLALLNKWTQVYNLTAIRRPTEMLIYHLLDTLAVVPLLKTWVGKTEDVRVLDVGSGGGLPGIPWSVACPDWHFTLVDTIRKKTAFLTQAKFQLQLNNVEVVTARIEKLAPEIIKNGFTILTSRAFAELADFVRLAGAYLAPQGLVVALKGNYPTQELLDLPPQWQVEQVHQLNVPGLDAQRHIVLLKSTAN